MLLMTLVFGELSEWSNVSVSKTDVRKRTEGSNPSLSAIFLFLIIKYQLF